jgi:hypothetical protein
LRNAEELQMKPVVWYEFTTGEANRPTSLRAIINTQAQPGGMV